MLSRMKDAGVTSGSPVRVDAHLKVLNEAVVNRAKQSGIEAIVYAPHFTQLPSIRATARRFSDEDIAVIPAREVFTGRWRNRQHVLALDLEDPVPDFISLEAAIGEFERQDAVVLVPHPGYLTVSLDRRDIEQYQSVIHGIETYNPKHFAVHNRRAEAIAKTTGLPRFGSSYAHLPGTVGEVWTTFPDIEPTVSAVIEAFRDEAPRTVEHRRGFAHQLRRGAEIGHLFYENSVTKIDRVLLSGTEPTHPAQSAYGDKFTVAG